MSNVITITLGRERTAEQAFNDAALVNGWTATVKHTTEHEQVFAQGEEIILPEGAYDIQKYTQEDGSVLVKYKLDKQIANPVSQIDFGKAVWAKSVDRLDRDVATGATKIRDEQCEGNGNTTIVS